MTRRSARACIASIVAAVWAVCVLWSAYLVRASSPSLEATTEPLGGGVRTLHVSAQGVGDPFSFAVTADMRYFAGPGQYDIESYFRGAVEAIAAVGGGAFMVTPGDLDPPGNVLWTITRTLGVTYTWYPVVGNHELPGAGQEPAPGANLAWLNAYDYGTVNLGPSGCPTTTYSFDHGNAHFAVLNEYCDVSGDDVTAGDVTDHLYGWLASDLAATDKAHVFVVGHEPAYPQPDADNGRIRHIGSSLDKVPEHRDRFWGLLRQEGVRAYICGHTHNYSAVKIDGVWQLDAGHARGLGDTGARSTVVLVEVGGESVRHKTYRDDASGGSYTLMHEGYLWAANEVYLPLVAQHTSATASDLRSGLSWLRSIPIAVLLGSAQSSELGEVPLWDTIGFAVGYASR